MTSTEQQRVELTFRPFSILTRGELAAELNHWERMARCGDAAATRKMAERHAARCREFLHGHWTAAGGGDCGEVDEGA